MTQLPKQSRARLMKVARDNFWARVRADDLPSGAVIHAIDNALDAAVLIAAQNAYVAGLAAALTDLHRLHPDLRPQIAQIAQAHNLTAYALANANCTPYDMGEFSKITTTERTPA
jgi:lysozyme family protein